MAADFLNDFEIDRLEELAAGEYPYNQWAKAILLLNWGASYSEAGQGSGLTARQARYRRDKFLRQRLEMFQGEADGGWVPVSAEGSVTAVGESQPDPGPGVKKGKPEKKGKNKKSAESKKGKKKKKKKGKSKSGKKKKKKG